jgi:hypothetical protein
MSWSAERVPTEIAPTSRSMTSPVASLTSLEQELATPHVARGAPRGERGGEGARERGRRGPGMPVPA